MKDNNNFTIHGFMRNRLKLCGNELSVYAIIYGFDGGFWGGAEYIADCIGISARQVEKYLADLTTRKFLSRETTSQVGCVKAVTYRVTTTEPRPNQRANNTTELLDAPIRDIIIYNKNKTKERTRGYEKIINGYTSDERLKSNLWEFIKMRTLKRNAPTDRALSGLLGDLDKLSGGNVALKNEIVETCVKRGWNAFYDFAPAGRTRHSASSEKLNKLFDEPAPATTERDGKQFDEWGVQVV